MCGHVGLAGNLEYKHEALMKRLLLIDVVRGADSTGLAAIRTSGNAVNVTKVASHPFDLFDHKGFAATNTASSSKVLLGHNRLATKGKINRLNAHPFVEQHIVGAHNGTLDQTAWTRLEEMLGEKFDVDSAALIAALDRFPVEEVIPEISGAWSLVWYDSRNDTLNFLRNKERPMWFAYSSAMDTLLWGSDYHILSAAIEIGEKKEISLYKEESKEKPDTFYSYWSSAEDVHYAFPLDAIRSKDQNKERLDKTVAKVTIKGKEKPAAVTYHGHGGSAAGNFPSRANNRSSTTTYRSSNDNAAGLRNFLKITTTSTVLPYSSAIERNDFDNYARGGCAWCHESVKWGDENLTIIEPASVILCANCTSHPTNTPETTVLLSPSSMDIVAKRLTDNKMQLVQ